MKKIFFTMLLLVGVAFSGNAQSKKLKEKATEKVEQLNAEIKAGDSSLELSEDQKKKIYDIQVTRMSEAKQLRKDGAEKEEIKAVNKKYNQQIFKDVLTKKQLKARRKGKDKN